MSKLRRSLFSFQGFLWLLTLFVALFLCVYPLVRNLWASHTWEKVPCYYAQETRHYFIDRDDQRYYGEAADFWYSFRVPLIQITPLAATRANNDYCFVSPGKPYEAVYRLDTPQHLDRALPRLGITAMLLVVACMLSWKTRKPSVSASAAPPSV